MIDLVAYTQRVPVGGETLVGDSFQMGFGGKGANQAVMARLLGAEVAMVNCLGDDSYGDLTLENMASYGIDITHMYRAPGASGVAPIWVEPDGTNRIIIIPGANHLLTGSQAVQALRLIPEISVVVGQLEILQETTTAAFAEARRRGIMTVLNPAPAAAVSEDLLGLCDWLIPNEVEFEALTGSSAESEEALFGFARQTGTRLAVTLGEQGVSLVLPGNDSVIQVPAPRVTAVDTTGAGDAFVGAFVVGLALGWEELRAAQLGNLCASDSVTRPGTQASFPSASECQTILTGVHQRPVG